MMRPALMGIVNVTPDSFSGGGRMGEEAVAYAQQLVLDGADVLDVGAESTRPGATLITPEAEWARLGPVLAAIHAAPWARDVRLSVDTRHPETAERALAAGAAIINDVGGLADPVMLELLANHTNDVVVMHALGLPADPRVTMPAGGDVVAEILAWQVSTMQRAKAYGIAPERLIFDPGIGFGKTAEQSLALMLAAQTFVTHGGRWLFGHSRKSFLTLFSDAPAADRDPLTLAFSVQLAAALVPYLRVHNVKAHALLMDRLCT